MRGFHTSGRWSGRRLRLRGFRRPPARRRRRFPSRGEAGFTFVEILAAMMIIFILLGAAGFAYFRYVARARAVAARDQIQIFDLALHSYYLDCQVYPTNEQGLAALWEKPLLEPVPRLWSGPYLTRQTPADPWGREYRYEAPGPNGLPFAIASYGADGAEGGEGDDADIVSWKD